MNWNRLDAGCTGPYDQAAFQIALETSMGLLNRLIIAPAEVHLIKSSMLLGNGDGDSFLAKFFLIDL